MSHSRRSNEQSPDVQSTEAIAVSEAKLFGINWPLPPWAIAPGALILLVGLVGYLTKLTVIPIVDDWQKWHETSKDVEYVSERQLEEFPKHYEEKPEQKSSFGAVADIKLYKSDGCLLVTRRSGNNVSQTWIPDLRHLQREPAPSKSASEPASGQASASGALPWEGTALAQVHGKCLNPHPGPFRQWKGTQSGDRRSCWVKVYRQWPDGCKQSQWFDTCYNVWDSSPDGSAKVTWEVCNH